MIKKYLSLLLALCLVAGCLTACGGEEKKAENLEEVEEGIQLLSFSQANSVEEMEKLDGKQVTIIGYMSTLSPVSGKFMYLMNLPYQSCPFCVPNTTQLSNTMAVYAKSKDGFKFTDRAIQVTGTLEFGDYTDEFGYVYNYRIKDATYTEVDTSNMTEELRLWQQLAATEVIADMYTMFEYVNFLCIWPTYAATFESGRDYLYPSDALRFIEEEGAQFHYGFQEGYFQEMIDRIQEVDPEAFQELVRIISEAKALTDRAYQELTEQKYSQVEEYTGEFGDGRKQYKMDAAEELEKQLESLYAAFSQWLSEWEL